MNTNIHFWLVKGMNLVRELEKDLKIANVICKVRNYSKFTKSQSNGFIFCFACCWFGFVFDCFLCVIAQNGRRNLTSSMNEASRDLIVHTHSKKKQALLVGPPTYFRHLYSFLLKLR